MRGTPAEADSLQIKKRIISNDKAEYKILESDSEVEEIAPPPNLSKPRSPPEEATVVSPESLQSIEETIKHYHTLSLPSMNRVHSPTRPELPIQSQDALSLIPYKPNATTMTRHPPEVTQLSLIQTPIPSLAVAVLEDEDMQSSWDFKKDQSQAAEVAEALNKIVKARHQKQQRTNLWVQSRINGMLTLCRLFCLPNSRLSWTIASEIAAEAVGHGSQTYVHKLRCWVIEFKRQGMTYTSLPLTQHGQFNTHRLFDEDLSVKIHNFLLELCKHQPFFKAKDIIDFVSTTDMQMAMGTKATTISIKTAQCWLKRMGWQYGKMPNGMYVDGHECEDVVEYCTWFLAEYKRLERWMRRFDKDGNIDKLPELQEGEQVLQEVTHDESTFYTND